MPIVPYFEEKGMNVGAPTPVGSSDTARLEGEALEGFGKALSTLGAVLGKEAKDAKDAQDEQEATTAAALYERQRLLSREQQKISNKMEDPFGRGYMQAIDNDVEKYVGTLNETTLTTDRARRIFQMKRAQVDTNLAAKELEIGVAGNAAYTKTLRDQELEAYTDIASNDISKLPLVLNKGTLAIEKDPDVPTSLKEEAINKYHQRTLLAVADGLKQKEDYEGAHSLLSGYSTTFQDADSKKVLQQTLDGINQAKWAKTNRDWDDNRRKRTLLNEHREETRNAKMGEMYTEIDNAVGDVGKVNSVIKKFETLRKADPQTFNESSVKEFEVFAKKGGAKTYLNDENFEGQVFRAYMTPGKGKTFNFQAAVTAITKGQASQEKKNELYGMIRSVNDSLTKDPVAAALFQKYSEVIGKEAAGRISPEEKRLYPNRDEAEAAKAQLMFLNRLKGRPITVEAVEAAAAGYKAATPGLTFKRAAPLSPMSKQSTSKGTGDSYMDARIDYEKAVRNKAPKQILDMKKRNLLQLSERYKDQQGDKAKVGK